MEVGVKFYSHNKVTTDDFDFADFVEILPVPVNEIGVFSNYDFKYRIHCPHDAFDFNPSNERAHEKNLKMWKATISAADTLNADRIVVHAGFNTEKLGLKNPKDVAIKFLSENFDPRICIENLLPVDGDLVWVAYGPEEIWSLRSWDLSSAWILVMRLQLRPTLRRITKRLSRSLQS